MLFTEIRLKTHRPGELSEFYHEVLELPVSTETGSLSVTAGKSKIVFEKTDQYLNPFYHFAFNIPSNKFEEAYEWMQHKSELLWLEDYKGNVADFVNWHAKSFYFLDPAGNILEFISRFDLNDNVSEVFTSNLVRNVSEIGLVLPAEGFQNDVDNLLKKYPLPYFDKQPPLPQFKAIGDDEGLLIIVPENRVWFSTKMTESKIFPLSITFLQDGVSYQLNQ